MRQKNENLKNLCLVLPQVNKGSIHVLYLSHVGKDVLCIKPFFKTQIVEGISLNFSVYQDKRPWVKVNIVTEMGLMSKFPQTRMDLHSDNA